MSKKIITGTIDLGRINLESEDETLEVETSETPETPETPENNER